MKERGEMMSDWTLPAVKRGGVEMPQKTDPHEATTPSGQFPTMITMAMWKAMEAEGWDMRWYAVQRMLPRSGSASRSAALDELVKLDEDLMAAEKK